MQVARWVRCDFGDALGVGSEWEDVAVQWMKLHGWGIK
jgi:hypothetical protein